MPLSHRHCGRDIETIGCQRTRARTRRDNVPPVACPLVLAERYLVIWRGTQNPQKAAVASAVFWAF